MRLHTLLDLHLQHSFIDTPPVESNSLILTGDIPTPGQRAFGWAVCAVILTDHRCIEWQDGADSRLSTSKDLLGEHHAVRQWLEQQLAVLSDGPTVVVTHHVPHALSVAPRFASDWATCGFVSALPDSFFVVPALWIHGHTHTRLDYRVGNYRIVYNPQRYATWGGDFEVDDFEPVFVIEVSP